MNFKKADKIVHDLYIVSTIFTVLFLFLRNSNPVLSWISFGMVIVISVITFWLNWKYMRCPYCDHIISAFRRGDQCNICGETLVVGADGNLVKVKNISNKSQEGLRSQIKGQNQKTNSKKKKK